MFYRIQLGAFSSVSSARSWKEKLERELNLKDVVIVESSGIFRVFYGKFEKGKMHSESLTDFVPLTFTVL